VQFHLLYSTDQPDVDEAIVSDHLMVLYCPACKGVHVEFYEEGHGGPYIVDGAERHQTGQWPPAGVRLPHAAVPGAVAADWVEAHKALGVGLWKSAVTMARRAVQGVCIDKHATGNKKLYDQIK
jgi:hypothetical protein